MVEKTLREPYRSSLNVIQSFDITADSTALRLSRSPRPYSRQRPPLIDEEIQVDDDQNPGRSSRQNEVFLLSKSLSTPRPAARSNSPSAHGTDVEEEEFRTARALPAPLTRPRKGLLGTDEAEQDWVSPLVSPATRQELDVSTDKDYFDRTVVGQDATKDVVDRPAGVGTDRQARELVRRVSEVLSLALIGYLTLQQEDPIGVRSQSTQGTAVTPTPIALRSAADCFLALFLMTLVTTALCATPLLRILLWPWRAFGQVRLGRSKLPSRLDPATVLYPVFLPYLVSASVYGHSTALLAANATLGLASLPASLIPYSSLGHPIHPLHWAVSLFPTLVLIPPGVLPVEEVERLAMLFPLHAILQRPLHYLTTSSLLPAELCLFSAGLINLWYCSSSPPMQILRILLWPGAVGFFFLTRHAFKRIVALERIQQGAESGGFIRVPRRVFWLSVLSGLGVPPGLTVRMQGSDQSDCDSNSRTTSVAAIPNATVQRPRAASLAFLPASNREGKNSQLSRSKTTSTISSHHRLALEVDATKHSPTPFLPKLTPSERKAQSLLLTAYIYAVAIVFILLPIRRWVGAQALGAYEPFSWAVGYLFGGIKSVRSVVADHGMSRSIPLPGQPTGKLQACLDREARVQCIRNEVLGTANTRLLLFGYWAGVIACGIVAVLQLSSTAEVDTRRKVFHGMMVVMLLPTAYVDPLFLALGLALVLVVFLLLDLFRAGQIKPLSRPLAQFLQPYVDGRDLKGPVIVSHIFLLIGCAIPFWLSLAGTSLIDTDVFTNWETEYRDVGMVAGVICVGMGDAAASLIGRRYGRHKWVWGGGKSLEGSLAFAAAVTVGLMAGKVWLVAGGWASPGHAVQASWLTCLARAALAGCGASFTEAVLTGCNDNVVVPIVLWLLVRGLRV